MRAAALVLLALGAPVSAQTGDALLQTIGYTWSQVQGRHPAPDSGAVAGGVGRLRWTAPDELVAAIWLDVERDRVRRATVQFVDLPEVEPRLGDTWLDLKREAGSPADPPFFTAQQLSGRLGHGFLWVDLWIDAARRRLVMRQPTDPPPPAPPPPPPVVEPPPPQSPRGK